MAKICLMTNSFPAEGEMETPSVVDFIRSLKKEHEITVLTHVDGETRREKRDGFDVVRFASGSIGGRAQLLWKGTKALHELQENENFDLWICFWAMPSGIYAALNLGILGTLANNRLLRAIGRGKPPYLVYCMGSELDELRGNPLGKLALRFVLSRAAGCYADSLALAKDVARVSSKSCTFIPSVPEASPNPVGEAEASPASIWAQDIRKVLSR